MIGSALASTLQALPLLTLTFCLILHASADSPTPRPAHVQEAFNELIASSRLWPSHVTTSTGFQQPIYRNGQPIGSVTIKPGTALKLASIKPEGVWVEVAGLQKLLPLEDTDLLQRIPARRAEVEAIELVQNQRLRERAELPIVWLQPPIPAEEAFPTSTFTDPIPRAPRIRIPGYNVPGWYYPPPVYRIIYLPTPIYPICPIKPIQPIQPCPPPRHPHPSGLQIALRLR
ncbi:MAG: hypothetical protein SNJ84_06505 [Verrucomicrobiia bacterium]